MSALAPAITPRDGAAGEYGLLGAVGPYRGCRHLCRYCYVWRRASRDPRGFREAKPVKDFLTRLELSAAKLAGDPRLVFLSFGCDPYQPLEARDHLTRQGLEILAKHGLRPRILTKGGRLALRDLDLFLALAAELWATLTTLDLNRAHLWEPGAAPPADRLDMLHSAWAAGIRTGCSLEPCIYPQDSLEVITRAAPFVRHFALGKLNHMTLGEVRQVDPNIERPDWRAYLGDAVALLERLGYRRLRDPHEPVERMARTYYVKQALRDAAV